MADTDSQNLGQPTVDSTSTPPPTNQALATDPNLPSSVQDPQLPHPLTNISAAKPVQINQALQAPQNYPPTVKDQDLQQAEELLAPPPIESEAIPSTDPTLQPSNSQTLPHEVLLQKPIQGPVEPTPTESPLQMKEASQFPQNAEPPNAATQIPQAPKESFLSYPTEPHLETATSTPVPIPQPMPVLNEPESIPTSVSPPQPEMPTPSPTSPPTPPTPTGPVAEPSRPKKGGLGKKIIAAVIVIIILGSASAAAFLFSKNYFTKPADVQKEQSTQTIEPQKPQEEVSQRDSSGFVLGESIQNFTVYSDLENNFSIEVPQDWKVLSAKKAGLTADFASPDEAFQLIIKNPQVVDDNQLLDTQTQELKSTLTAEITKPQIGETKRLLVNSLAANRFETIETEGGQTFQAVYLLIFKDNKIFTVKAFGPQQTFDSQNQTIERILASFR